MKCTARDYVRGPETDTDGITTLIDRAYIWLQDELPQLRHSISLVIERDIFGDLTATIWYGAAQWPDTAADADVPEYLVILAGEDAQEAMNIAMQSDEDGIKWLTTHIHAAQHTIVEDMYSATA